MDSSGLEQLNTNPLAITETLTVPEIPGVLHVETDPQRLSRAHGEIFAVTNPDIVSFLNKHDTSDSLHRVKLPGDLRAWAAREFQRKVAFVMFRDDTAHIRIDFPNDKQEKYVIGINPAVIAKSVASDAPYWKLVSNKPITPSYTDLPIEAKIILLRDVINRYAQMGLAHAILQERDIVPIITENVKQKRPFLSPLELGAIALLVTPFMGKLSPGPEFTLEDIIFTAGRLSTSALAIRGILTHDRHPEQTAVERFAIDLIDSHREELSTVNPIELNHEL